MSFPKIDSWAAALWTALFLLCLLPMGAQAQPTECPTCEPDNNLIWYGDFSISSTTLPVPVSTSLNPLCACNYSPGVPGYGSYCIETDAYNKCTSFDHILDHTNPGVSRFMVVDGFPTTDPPTPTDPNIVWKDEIFISTPGVYDFSFWVMPNLSSSTGITPVFNFRVDYTAVVTNIGTSPTLDTWNQYCMTANFPDPGWYVLEIAQTNTGNGSNDYGIDDIYLGQCCSCSVDASFTYNQISPNPFEVNFSSNSTFSPCTSAIWYEWDFGDGNNAAGASLSGVSNTYPGPGWYTVCLTVWALDDYGMECFDEFCYEVYVRPEEGECRVQADFAVNGNSAQAFLTNFSTISTNIDQWTYTIYDPYLPPYSITSSTTTGDAATSPGWNGQFTPSGPGVYMVCLTVYDYDIPDCYSTVCLEFELEGGGEVPCDAVPSFVGTLIGAPATWQFNNTSTASSPMIFSWNIIDLNSGPGASYPNQQDITHTFINAHTYQICLTVTQLNTPLGVECTFTYCETITIDEVSDHLNFNLGYTCKDQPELYINFLSTNAPQVDINTTCVGGSTPQNNGIYGIPLTTPMVVADQPPYNWSSCWVTVTTIGLSPNISATQYMYFNCQPCPGTPGFDSGEPNVFQAEPSGTVTSGISVFPNPSSPGELQVLLDELSGPSSLQVVDIEGKVLQTFNIDIEYARLRMPLNTAELGAGLYFLRLQTADEVTVKKFVIK